RTLTPDSGAGLWHPDSGAGCTRVAPDVRFRPTSQGISMPPRRPQNESSASSWWLVVIVAIAIAAGLYYWWQRAGAPSPELAGGPAPTSQSGGGFAPADGPEADEEKLADAQQPPEDAPKPADGPKHP